MKRRNKRQPAIFILEDFEKAVKLYEDIFLVSQETKEKTYW